MGLNIHRSGVETSIEQWNDKRQLQMSTHPHTERRWCKSSNINAHSRYHKAGGSEGRGEGGGINKSEETSSHNTGFTLHEIWSSRKTQRQNKAKETRPSPREASWKRLGRGTNLHRRVCRVWLALQSNRLHLIVNSPVQHLEEKRVCFWSFHPFIHLVRSRFNTSGLLFRLFNLNLYLWRY